MQESKVIKKDIIFEGKWLNFSHVTYTSGDSIIPNYQSINRTRPKEKNIDIDGVDIIPIIKYQNKPPEIVMILNFRVPIKSYCLEFPTGLAEDNDY